MQRLRSGAFFETRYPGPILGAVPSEAGILLIDCPPRTDDSKDWIAQLLPHGRPSYLAMLDHHPDRALGARAFDLPIIAHEATLSEMRGWPDAYKGAAHPIGAEADSLKRITGVGKAVPDLGFSDELELHLGERRVLFWHRPGPTAGAMWVVLPEAEVAFVGDLVSISEPPYVGQADIEAWLAALDELRTPAYEDFILISGRDGRVGRDELNAMARFVRKIPVRLERLEKRGDSPEAAERIARNLAKDFKLPNTRRDQVMLRLQTGLRSLYSRSYPQKS